MEPEECAAFRNAIENKKNRHAPQQEELPISNNQKKFNYLYMTNTTLYMKQQNLNEQQVHIKKKNLRILMIFLCASVNFGKYLFYISTKIYSAFTGNSMPPLQREIQQQMGIIDSDFNLIICIRNLPNLIVPFVLANFIEKYGMKKTLISLSIMCSLGQLLQTLGLTYMNFYLCAIGRIIFGFRSLISAYYVTTIHEAVIENNLKDRAKEKEKEEQELIKSKNTEKQIDLDQDVRQDLNQVKKGELPYEYFLLCIVYSFGFCCVHSFYHNMSNLLQSRFGFNNEDAGHISSLPYIIAAFSTPILGMIFSRFGERHYDKVILSATFTLLIVHSTILYIPDALPGQPPQYLVIAPIALFGLGHALFLAKAFSYMKISENIGTMLMTYTTGIIRVRTNSFHAVNALFTTMAVIVNIAALVYYRAVQIKFNQDDLKQQKEGKDIFYDQINQFDDSIVKSDQGQPEHRGQKNGDTSNDQSTTIGEDEDDLFIEENAQINLK
ncbi:major facilitator superfamily protein [Stylonychia lemnae]|uniref:Major facilitator superfamily protein n=1 Tax=Stylonychia lemnae TaxID=5949 RepID=A0A078AXP2_STYLE|nr:major facilitator superfamily protein [Stylonychia lemnae]|eukprot:CDW86836.1 major facilitator superfamily protein [Stylonychia lemnae]